MLISISLPWPPTANTYWRRKGERYFITPKGIEYRKLTTIRSLPYHHSELYDKRLSVFVAAFPPDKRRRDIDNILKVLIDSLQYAEIYHDDCQIDSIYIKRMPDLLNQVVVKIEEMIIA